MPKSTPATHLAVALNFRRPEDPYPKITVPPITSAEEYEVALEYYNSLPHGISQGWGGIEHRQEVDAVLKAYETAHGLTRL